MAAPIAAHPTKAKFASSKSQLSFTFAATDTRGLAMKNHHAYH
jgi:hypothetical protein